MLFIILLKIKKLFSIKIELYISLMNIILLLKNNVNLINNI
jgi:hypothetical protein